MALDKVTRLFEVEFDDLIEKQARAGLDLADLRRLDILTRSYKSYISNPIKKNDEEDLSLYTDDVLKKILQGTRDGTKTKSEGSGLDEADGSGKADTDEGT